MRKISLPVFIPLLLLVSSCYVTVHVSRSKIRSNYTLHKMSLSRIDSVVTFDKYGVPAVYLAGKTFVMEEDLSKMWFYRERGAPWGGRSLPAEFSQPGWYRITGIPSFDRAPRDLLFYRTDKGKIHSFYRSPVY